MSLLPPRVVGLIEMDDAPSPVESLADCREGAHPADELMRLAGRSEGGSSRLGVPFTATISADTRRLARELETEYEEICGWIAQAR